MPDQAKSDRICLGVIVGAHGVRGVVKVKTFADDPTTLESLGPVEDEAGVARFTLKLVGEVKGAVLAKLDGVVDRNRAEALRGTKLMVARDRLPPLDEEEYYHSDLIGLAVEDTSGERLGVLKAIFDFGAGDVLDVDLGDGKSAMFPFTRQVVPVVDVAGKRIVIDPPVETEAKPVPGVVPEGEDGDMGDGKTE